jgi:hypothetical protein
MYGYLGVYSGMLWAMLEKETDFLKEQTMKTKELEKIREQYVAIVENKLKNALSKRSDNENKIQRLQENLATWNDILTNYINKVAHEFAVELNSENFVGFTSLEKDTANESFREKTKELILEYNRKFLLG